MDQFLKRRMGVDSFGQFLKHHFCHGAFPCLLLSHIAETVIIKLYYPPVHFLSTTHNWNAFLEIIASSLDYKNGKMGKKLWTTNH